MIATAIAAMPQTTITDNPAPATPPPVAQGNTGVTASAMTTQTQIGIRAAVSAELPSATGPVTTRAHLIL
jgi:hypothetical protein